MNTQDTNYTIDNANEAMFKKLSRELRATRIFCTITSLLMVCVLLGGCMAFKVVQGCVEQIMPVVEEIVPVAEQLATVDFAVLNETMVRLDGSLQLVDWEAMSDQLAALDVEAINKAIQGLDTEELTVALENLNEAADTLKKISESLKKITSKFGF